MVKVTDAAGEECDFLDLDMADKVAFWFKKGLLGRDEALRRLKACGVELGAEDALRMGPMYYSDENPPEGTMPQ